MYTQQIIVLQDQLLGEVIGLARASEGNEDLISSQTDEILIRGLVLTSSMDAEEIQQQIGRVREEKQRIVPNCFECAAPCGRTAAYDIMCLGQSEDQINMLKTALILCLRSIAAEQRPAQMQNEVKAFLYNTLVLIGMDMEQPAALISALETGSRLYRQQRAVYFKN